MWEHVGKFSKKPIRFIYCVYINLNAHPRYHRTPVIWVETKSAPHDFAFYSKIHFMNYLKYWKISLDSLPTNFVKAIDMLCARPQFVPLQYDKYSRICVPL